MKKQIIINNIIEYLLLIVGSYTLAGITLLFFLPSQNIGERTVQILIACAVVLFLPCFFKKAAAVAGGSALILVSVGFFYLQIKYDIVKILSVYISALSTAAGSRTLFMSVFMLSLTCICGIVLYIASRFRACIVCMFVSGTAFTLVLSQNYGISPLNKYLVFIGICAALFFHRSALLTVRKHGGNIRGIPKLSAIAAVLCAAAVVFSQVSFDKLHDRFKNVPKIDFVQVVDGLNIQGISNLKKSGFSDYNPNRKMGGSIRLDDTEIFEVKADGPFYLRGRIYDKYTGENWRCSTPKNPLDVYNNSTTIRSPGYFGNFKTWKAANKNSTNYNYFVSTDFYKDSAFLKKNTLTITVKTDNLYYLMPPPNYEMDSTQLPVSLTIDNYYPEMHTNQPIEQNKSLSVNYYTPLVTAENSEKAIESANENYNNIKSDQWLYYYTQDLDNYFKDISKAFGSQDNITKRTRELALNITKNCRNEFQKAEAIKNWLQKNCRYTLNPPQVPKGSNFVDYFIFTSKAGYCEHFASAMTVMLRAAGVPSRYIEGYASPQPSENGIYKVTNKQAHAWVEFYSEMFGFITADPTPADGLAKTGIANTVRKAPVTVVHIPGVSSEYTTTQASPSGVSASASTSSGSSGLQSNSKNKQNGKVPILTITAVILGIAAFLVILYFGRAILRTASHFAIKRKKPKVQIIWYYNFYASALEHLGFKRTPSMTPNEFADKVRGRFIADFDGVTRIYIKASYTNQELNNEDLKIVSDYYDGFIKNCRDYMGIALFIRVYPML